MGGVTAAGADGFGEQGADHRREVAVGLGGREFADPGQAFGGEADADEGAAGAWSGHVLNTMGEAGEVLNTSVRRRERAGRCRR